MSFPNLYPVKPHNLHIFLLTNKSKLNRCELLGRLFVSTVFKKVEMGFLSVLLSSLVFLAKGIDTLTIYIYEYIGGGLF